MRFILAILLLIMLSFVFVQYNDPDPAIWMALYGYCSILIVLALLEKFHPLPFLIGMAVYLLYALYLSPSVLEWYTREHGQNLMQRMAVDKMYIEETRECLGLVIAFAVSLFTYLTAKNKASANSK